MIQYVKFTNSSFALHNIDCGQLSTAHHTSAWYNDKGEIVDAENIFVFNRNGRRQTKQVNKNSKVWKYLATLGKRYVQKI